MSELIAAAVRSVTGWPVVGFAEPLWLWLLPISWTWLLAVRWLGTRPALGWPALAEASAAGAHRLDPAGTAVGALRLMTVSLIGLVLAQPMGSEQEVKLRHDGLDLILALDASGSMRALDARGVAQPQTRLNLAKEVVARFAAERVAEGDRVGLIVFGDRAFTQSPLSSDGALVAAALERVEAGMAGESTALGDALGLAVKRAGPPRGPGDPLAGRVVVLLTDGRSNAGNIPPEVAMAIAQARGVRVHTVGIGGQGQVAMARRGGGRRIELERHDLDTQTLQRIAAHTGGRYFGARSSSDLALVYGEIDQLERVEREAAPRHLGAPLPEPFLACAGSLLLAQLIVGRVLARRLP
ncbi:MAG: VWA domain-containing protein [bacterium]|nr:VWA domain-containing protein [bacterium]MCP5071606.1 VWA domain-containing protein [bacterium]